MTCLCGHPWADHQIWEQVTGDQEARECDLCECPWFTDAATPPMFGGDDE